MFFEHSNRFFWWRKSLTTHFFLMCGNKEKSLGVKLYGGWPINSTFWPVKKTLVWTDMWEPALSWWTMIRLLLFVFRISPKTLGKQIVVHNSEVTVLRYSSRTVATWPVLPKKQATICFAVPLPQQVSLDLACLRRPTWWTIILFRPHMPKSMIYHLWRSNKRLKHRDRMFSNISKHSSTIAFF